MVSQLPNFLSASRIALVPVLFSLAWNGSAHAFLLLLALGLMTDIEDGILARRLGVESEFGARLDQWGDFALWLALPVGAWWLWRDVVIREAFYIGVAVLAMLVPTAIGYWKYDSIPGYHTWTVKAGAAFMGGSVALLLIFGLPRPFRAAALFQLVCAIDEIGITLLLRECQHDVPSVFHAAWMRRRKV